MAGNHLRVDGIVRGGIDNLRVFYEDDLWRLVGDLEFLRDQLRDGPVGQQVEVMKIRFALYQFKALLQFVFGVGTDATSDAVLEDELRFARRIFQQGIKVFFFGNGFPTGHTAKIRNPWRMGKRAGPVAFNPVPPIAKKFSLHWNLRLSSSIIK